MIAPSFNSMPFSLSIPVGKEYDMTRMAVVMKNAQKEIRNIVPNTSSTPSDAKKATNKLLQVTIWHTILYILYPLGLGNWRKAMMDSIIQEIIPAKNVRHPA